MEQRRREVERGDPFAPRSVERLLRVPARQRARSSRRRGASRAASGCPSCGRAASRRAFGHRSGTRAGRLRAPPARSARCERGTPFGRPVVPGRVEHQARLALVEVECAGMLGRRPAAGRPRGATTRGAAVLEAVVELGLRQAPRERHERRAAHWPPSRGARSRRGCRARRRGARRGSSPSPPAIRAAAARSSAYVMPGSASASGCARRRRAETARGSPLRRLEDRGDDRLVARAAAEVAARAGRRPPRASPAPRPRRSVAAIRIPGVQKPHCSAWCARNASCSGRPSRPSTVRSRTRRPAPRASGTSGPRRRRADGAGAADAVLAADVRAGQPELWRRKSESSRRGSTSPRTSRPLTVTSITDACSSARVDDDAVEVPQVRRRRVQVPRRIDERCGARAGLARGLGVAGAPSSSSSSSVGRSTTAPTPTRADAISPRRRADEHAHIAEREVSVAERDLLEADACRPRGHVGLDEQLVRLERGRVMRDEEVLGRELARPLDVRTAPPSTRRQSGSSALASAWAIEPPTVPRFRVTKWPTYGSALGHERDLRRAESRWRTVAPTRHGRCRASTSPSDAVDVDEHATAAASRKLSIGTRLCPPASTFASSPCSASSATASSSVSGRS